MSNRFVKTSTFNKEQCGLEDDKNLQGNCIGLPEEKDSACDDFGCDKNEVCDTFDISESGDECLISDYIESSINIGGAKLNVHKLLGVKERTLLLDTTQNGEAISSGDIPNFGANNVFNIYDTEWRSMHTGTDVIKNAYIGYDYGDVKLSNGRNQYGVDTFVKYNIGMLKIRQGCSSKNRATKIRLERSNDNHKWYGVALLNLEDCNGVQEFTFNKSVPSRFWRIRPVEFNGTNVDYWSVKYIQLADYEATHISNIEDKIFMENRNRDYEEYAVKMKCSYQPIDNRTNVSKWGFNNLFSRTEQYILEVSFSQAVNALGRPFVIGDIIELPSETQYTPDLKPVLKYLEITNVSWSVNGFTPSWKPTIQSLVAEPLLASQESQDILGKIDETLDENGTVDLFNQEADLKYQDIKHISDTIQANADTAVPQNGLNDEKLRKFSKEDVDKVVEHFDGDERARDFGIFNKRTLPSMRDGMPPNGEAYTEGTTFPENPKDGDYHRLTFDVEQKIATRLHRFSGIKEKWIFMETDERMLHDDMKPVLQEFVDPSRSTRTDLDDIDDKLEE